MKEELTIFTPTYNRKNLLKRLVESLEKQVNLEFEWIIVDDGSNDGTREYIENIKDKSNLKITYIYQNNSGKYVAHNTAVKECKTEYFVCIDSDDWVSTDFVSKIYDVIKEEKISNRKELCGFFFVKNINDDYKIVDVDNKKIFDIMDLKFYYNKNIETVIIMKNSILKQYLFKENREKFMSEEVLYNELAKSYKFLFLGIKNLCFSEYLESGLTKNLVEIWINNPENTTVLLNSRFEFLKKYNFKIRIINRIKTILNFNALYMKKNSNILRATPSKFYSIILIIPSMLWEKIKYEAKN